MASSAGAMSASTVTFVVASVVGASGAGAEVTVGAGVNVEVSVGVLVGISTGPDTVTLPPVTETSEAVTSPGTVVPSTVYIGIFAHGSG